jgi:thiamine-phosphate pyrophosphorylase
MEYSQVNSVPSQFGFYGILTNPLCGYDRLTRLLVDHGIAFIQLRMKEGSRDDMLRVAEQMRRITENSASRFIVNDYPDIAAEIGADGVHVGQNDVSCEEARSVVGPESIVGLSTHNPRETREACAKAPDYVGVGPVYATPTKKIPDPPIGLDGMKEMLDSATVPAVVLGAITAANLRQVLEAGARNFSLVRPLNSSQDPEKALMEILAIYKSFC